MIGISQLPLHVRNDLINIKYDILIKMHNTGIVRIYNFKEELDHDKTHDCKMCSERAQLTCLGRGLQSRENTG